MPPFCLISLEASTSAHGKADKRCPAERSLADRVAALGHVTAFVERLSQLTQAGAEGLDASMLLCPLLPGTMSSMLARIWKWRCHRKISGVNAALECHGMSTCHAQSLSSDSCQPT